MRNVVVSPSGGRCAALLTSDALVPPLVDVWLEAGQKGME